MIMSNSFEKISNESNYSDIVEAMCLKHFTCSRLHQCAVGLRYPKELNISTVGILYYDLGN